jgi:site-specific recombinase XerC
MNAQTEKNYLVEQFVQYLEVERNASPRTVIAYRQALQKFIRWARDRLVRQAKPVFATDRLMPGQLIGLSSMAGEAVVAEAQGLLGTLEQIDAEIGRDI